MKIQVSLSATLPSILKRVLKTLPPRSLKSLIAWVGDSTAKEVKAALLAELTNALENEDKEKPTSRRRKSSGEGFAELSDYIIKGGK